MVSVVSDIKGILSVQAKPRYDTFSDQYNRIFMVKLLLVCTVIMGFSWYKDPVNCIVPAGEVSEGFVSPACWIQGMYVYKELLGRVDKIAYFGMPINMDNEGMMEGTTDLCNLRPKLSEKPNPKCKAMTKTFYLQYQWMPFLIGALAVIYYAPYVAFLYVNNDMKLLKEMMRKEGTKADNIANYFFHTYNPKLNKRRFLTFRIIMNVVCKVLYLLSNIFAILIIDNVLNGEYIPYGVKWIRWCRLENSMAYDYMGARDYPKPGNLLLPPFGYCEMYESSKDIKITMSNRHKFVCELSQHILYQYCLFVLWVAIVIGIILTIFGVVQVLLHYCLSYIGMRNESVAGRKLLGKLKFREIEYLEFIRRKDVGLLEEVVNKLRARLLDARTTPSPLENVPLYPTVPYDESSIHKKPSMRVNRLPMVKPIG